MKRPQEVTNLSRKANGRTFPVVGFSGYFVDEINRVFSCQSYEVKEIRPWVQKYPSGHEVLRITLFDDNGKRRSISYKKKLIESIAFGLLEEQETVFNELETAAFVKQHGKKEFERREREKAGLF